LQELTTVIGSLSAKKRNPSNERNPGKLEAQAMCRLCLDSRKREDIQVQHDSLVGIPEMQAGKA